MGGIMSLILQGSTSGSVTLQEPAVAGTTVLTLPTTSGTVLTSASTIPSSQLTNAGLVRVTSGTLSSASAITVDGCFTSTYVNYVIYVNAAYTGSADQDAYLQFRASGSTNSSAAYPYNVNYINAGVNAGTASSSSGGATSWVLYDNMDSGAIFNGVIQVFNPQTSTKTTGQWFLYAEDSGNFKQMLGFGFQSQSTAFDGFTLTLQSGTLTGTYDIYGVAR
jgi:hypothetical protein